MPAVTTLDLDRLLRVVSRSIYLTLKVAPRRTRRQLGVGYLFCRAADTIADTRFLPPAERVAHLRAFRAQFEGDAPSESAVRAVAERVGRSVGPGTGLPEERELLEKLWDVFALHNALGEDDRRLLRRLVTTLTEGMEMDLGHFPAEESGEVGALETDADLDRYTYHVAGCVGEFWTDLHLLHLGALRRWDAAVMREKAVRFGKGLQLTNILRDLDRDLAIGRCYLPRRRLDELGLSPEGLRAVRDRSAARPVVHALLGQALAHYRAGWEYTLAVPRRLVSLRLACAWPLLIGLRTLELIARAEDPCAPGQVLKVSRRDLRRLMLASTTQVLSNRLLERTYVRLEARVSRHLLPAHSPQAVRR